MVLYRKLSLLGNIIVIDDSKLKAENIAVVGLE
jgi:hypothetical protein